jgi:hypothetical protein
MTKKVRVLAIVGIIASTTAFMGASASPASAAPIGRALADIPVGSAQIERVHYRDWRHCHWRYGDRWCHGQRYGYYRHRPGFSIYLNLGDRGWRHRRHHRHHGEFTRPRHYWR